MAFEVIFVKHSGVFLAKIMKVVFLAFDIVVYALGKGEAKSNE